MSKQLQTALGALKLTDEQIEAINSRVDATNRSITDQQLIVRSNVPETGTDEDESDEENPVPESAVDPVVNEDGDVLIEIDDDTLAEIATAVEQRTGNVITELRGLIEAMGETQAQLVTSLGEVTAENQRLNKRLADLEKPEQERQRELLEDLPRKGRTVTVTRPRTERTREQADDEAAEVDMTEKARNGVAGVLGMLNGNANGN